MRNWYENGILLQEAITGSYDWYLLDEATSGLRRDLNCRLNNIPQWGMSLEMECSGIVPLILIRKLEAEDTNRSRLDEEMLGHRLYISATGWTTPHSLELLDEWNISALYCYTHPGLAGHRACPRRKCSGSSWGARTLNNRLDRVPQQWFKMVENFSLMLIEILYYRCKHENNVLTLVVGSSFLLSPASEKGKCILWVSDFY